MVNTDGIVTATFPTPGGRPRYDGDTAIDGVPGTAAAVVLDFEELPPGGPGGRVPDRERHRRLRRHPGDLRGQRDAGRRGRRGQLRQERLRVDRRAGGRRGAEQARPGTAARGGQGDGAWRRQRHHGAEDLAGRAARARRRRSAPGRSSRSGCTSPSGCSARSASAPRSWSPARSATTSRCSAAGPRLSIEHPSGALEVEVELDLATTPPTVIRSGVVRTAASSSTASSSPR